MIWQRITWTAAHLDWRPVFCSVGSGPMGMEGGGLGSGEWEGEWTRDMFPAKCPWGLSLTARPRGDVPCQGRVPGSTSRGHVPADIPLGTCPWGHVITSLSETHVPQRHGTLSNQNKLQMVVLNYISIETNMVVVNTLETTAPLLPGLTSPDRSISSGRADCSSCAAISFRRASAQINWIPKSATKGSQQVQLVARGYPLGSTMSYGFLWIPYGAACPVFPRQPFSRPYERHFNVIHSMCRGSWALPLWVRCQAWRDGGHSGHGATPPPADRVGATVEGWGRPRPLEHISYVTSERAGYGSCAAIPCCSTNFSITVTSPHHTTAQLSTPQRSSPQRSTPQHTTAHHRLPQRSTAHHGTPQRSTAQHTIPDLTSPHQTTPHHRDPFKAINQENHNPSIFGSNMMNFRLS